MSTSTFPARIPPAAVGLLALIPATFGQAAMREAMGEHPFHGFGTSVATAGDLDGDGVLDYWVGSPDVWGYGPSGFVRLYSGAGGTRLREIHGSDGAEWFGATLAAGGDVDGDGLADVAVGAPENAGGRGAVYVFRGHAATDRVDLEPAEPWFVLRGEAPREGLGTALLFVGDLDGDGASELAVGGPGGTPGGAQPGVPGGRVRVVSGRSGALLWELAGAPASELGTALAQVSDLDGDGVADLWIGAPAGGSVTPGAGAVWLVSARSGARLGTLEGDTSGDRFGHAVAAAGRLAADDGTAGPDAIAGAIVGAPGGGYVRALSGAGLTLFSASGPAGATLENWAPTGHEGRFGASVLGVGDQNGDGVEDLAVGYPAYSGLWILSGADGAELERVASTHQPSKFVDPMSVFFGHALARLDDHDGDGRPELLVGAPHDFEQLSGQSTAEWDVGAVDVLSVATDPAWVGGVSELSGAGDVDGDGYADVAYGRGGGLEIRSGKDQALLRAWPNLSVVALAPAGDANGDGWPDLVVGGAGVRVLSGRDGGELWSASGQGPDGLGLAVAGLGDVDGDGFDDVAAGAPFVSPTTFAGCDEGPGYVRIYSGRSGDVLLQVDGRGLPNWDCQWGPRSEGFGLSVTGTGDWNRDGTPDFAVGAPGAGAVYGGQVRVFSGRDGALLDEFEGTWGDGEFGIALGGGARFDVNADGYVDLVIGQQLVGYGPYAVTQGRAVVVSSRDGSQLASVMGTQPPLGYGHFVGPGYAVAALGDVDLDGHADFALGNPAAPGLLGPGVGEILVVSGRTNLVLARHEGVSSWDYLGYALAAAGDTDGDGAADLLGLAWGSLGTGLPTSPARSRVYTGPAATARAGAQRARRTRRSAGGR